MSSCGTCFCTAHESDYPALTITSNVSDAEVYLNGDYVGITPYSHFGNECDVKRIKVCKAGYKSKTIRPRELKSTVYWNFVPYPLWNWIWGYFLDRSMSKCWRYKDDHFNFELTEKKE